MRYNRTLTLITGYQMLSKVDSLQNHNSLYLQCQPDFYFATCNEYDFKDNY